MSRKDVESALLFFIGAVVVMNVVLLVRWLLG